MKSAIIATVDALAYLAFAIVGIVGLGMMGQGNGWAGFAVLSGGWLVCCLVFGAWFLLSNINDNLQKIADKQ